MGISVIIPTLNEASNICRTVQHIVQHGGARICEIIVVDGGSTDDTVRLAETAGVRVMLLPGGGRAGQLAAGAAESFGDILYFVHADTLPPADFATAICAAVGKGHRMGNFRYDFDSPSALLKINAYFTRFRWFFTQGGDRTFFISRELYFELGGYGPSLVIMEEYDFLRRALRADRDYVVLPGKCLVSARKYEHNSWLKVQLANFLAYNLWAWGLARPANIKKWYKYLLLPKSGLKEDRKTAQSKRKISIV